MKAVCYYCDKDIELDDSNVETTVSPDHPYIYVRLAVTCPECGEQEVRCIDLDDFFQERNIV